MTGRLHVVVAGLLLGLLVTLLSGTTPLTLTAQKWSQLALSRDGRHWSSTLDAPLFEKRFRFVPGDTQVKTFHVLNRSNDKAEVKVRIEGRDPSHWLRNQKFRIRVRLDDRRWILVREDGGQSANHMLLAPGQSVPVSVRVRLRRYAGNSTMNRHLSLSLQVRLSQLTSSGESLS